MTTATRAKATEIEYALCSRSLLDLLVEDIRIGDHKLYWNHE